MEQTDLSNAKVFNLIQPQSDFLLSEARYPAFVGGWGTGKSSVGIIKAMELSEDNPGNLGVIFRKEFEDLKDSTIKDFEDYTGLKVSSSREVKLSNNSTIMFRHMEELNNLQNINLGWFLIEQAEELDTDEQFFKLWGRLRRANVPHKGMVIANTKGHNWIYKLWKLGELEDGVLFEAKTQDNAHNLPDDFVTSLEQLKTKKPKLYARFVDNSWEESDTQDVIIQPQWVWDATQRELPVDHPVKAVVSIDVARYGDDKTVFYAIENNVCLAKEVWEKKSTMEVVGYALRFAKKHDIQSFAVDEIGVGGGVADRISELGHQVVFVNSAERKNVRNECYNRRAEIYLNGSELFEEGKVQILVEDQALIEQLSWSKYKAMKSNGVFQVEPKEDIKKRYGQSPDEADAFLNGLWALPQVKDKTHPDKYKRHGNRRREFNPMTV